MRFQVEPTLASQKRMENICNRLTTDGASAAQPSRAIDACTLVTARDESRVNGSFHADAANIVAYFARSFPLPVHVLLKSDEKLAGILQRSDPFCILWIVLNDCVEELAAVLSDFHNTAMLILNELGECLQVSRKCPAFRALTQNPRAIPWIVDGNFMIRPPSVLPAPQHTLSQMGRCFPFRSSTMPTSGCALGLYTCARLI